MPGQRFPRFTAPRTPAPPNPGSVIFGTVTVSSIGSTVSITGSAQLFGFATSASINYTESTTQSLVLARTGELKTTVSGIANTVSVTGSVSVPNTVSVTGSVTVIGGTITGSFGAGGTATAADPSYGEGTTASLSLDLSGHLRTVMTTLTGITNTVSVQGTVTANPTTSAGFTTSQVIITSTVTATQIFASGASIIFREVTNPTASNATIFLGSSAVTTTSGHFCVGGSAVDWNNNSAAIFAVTATGSVTVSTMGW